MAVIVSVHSFRGGTGKSNTTANVAALLAVRREARRGAIIDADIQSPGIHVLFGIAGHEVSGSLNEFLWGERAIGEVALDVTDGRAAGGRRVPDPVEHGAGRDHARPARGLRPAPALRPASGNWSPSCELDVLLIDTHPGLNEETLLSLVLSHSLLIVMRPDEQDYEGTGITARIARELEVPRVMIMVNKTPEGLDPAQVESRVREAYGCDVAAVLPHSDELMRLASSGVFSLRFPAHPMTDLYRQVAARITDG